MKNFDVCPVCRKEREIKKKGGSLVMKDHRRWDGIKMVDCEGSQKPPQPFRRML